MKIKKEEINKIPLMEYAQFEPKEDHTLITLTNDNDVVCKLKIKDIIDKRCIINLATLKALKALGECTVNISKTFDITSPRGKYKGKLVSDYVIVDFKIEMTNEVKLNNVDLLKASKFVSLTKKTGSTKIVLTGVYINDNSICATDSFKLYTKKYEDDFNVDKVKAILHPSFINFACKYNFSNIDVNEKQSIVVTSDGLMIIGKLILGDYPDTSRLISLDNSVKTNFKVEDIAEYINTALNISSASENDQSGKYVICDFMCKEKKLLLQTNDYLMEDILETEIDFDARFADSILKVMLQFPEADIYYKSQIKPVMLVHEQEQVVLLPMTRSA